MRFHHHHHSHGSSKPATPGVLRTFFSIFAIFGMVFAVIGVKTWMKGEATRYWLSVPGAIVSSEVERHSDSDHGTTYGAEVVYSYTFHSKDYKGNKISVMEGSSSDRSAAQRKVDKYSPGSEVKVFVNPDDPYEAVLVQGGTLGVFIFVFVGGLFASIGVWGFLSAPRLAAESQAKANAALGQAGVNPTEDRDALSELGKDVGGPRPF